MTKVFLKVVLPIIIFMSLAGAGVGVYFGFFHAAPVVEPIVVPDNPPDPVDPTPDPVYTDEQIVNMYPGIYAIEDADHNVVAYGLAGADADYFEDLANIFLPETYKGLPITRIGYRNVYNQNNFDLAVTFVNYTSEIGDELLNNSAAYGPFVNWKSIESVKLTKNIDTIGDTAFSGCSNLVGIDLSDAADDIVIGAYAFYKTDSMVSIELPADKNSIYLAPACFSESGIESIDIDDNVILTAAEFLNCKYLQSATISENVQLPVGFSQELDKDISCLLYTFCGCESLTDVNILANADILLATFRGCSNLETLDVESIGASYYASTFAGCEKLTSILLPNNVAYIYNGTFENCGIVEIKLPKTLTKLERDLFKNCTSLKRVVFEGVWNSSLNTYCSAITEIGEGCFSGCTSLQSFAGNWTGSTAKILGNVTTVKYRAFEDCSAFECSAGTLSLDSCTAIGSNAFAQCLSIKNFLAPKLSNIPSSGSSDCFSGCAFDRFELGVNSLSHFFDFVSGLTSVKQLALPKLTNMTNSFNYFRSSLQELEIGNVASFRLDNITKLVRFKIGNAADNVVPASLSYFSAYGCSSLTNVAFETGTTSIGSRAFYNCTSLTEVDIPDTVTNIGELAFQNCSALKSIQLPNTVTSIGAYAFSYCSALSEINMPSSLQTIGKSAFANCAIKKAIFPEGLTQIGELAFSDCRELYCVSLPSTLVEIDGSSPIGLGAFGSCVKLTVVINNSNLDIVAGQTTHGGVASKAVYVIGSEDQSVFDEQGLKVNGRRVLRDVGNVVVYTDLETILITWNGAVSTTTTLPSASRIWSYAFSAKSLNQVRTLVIPNTVSVIDQYAFSGSRLNKNVEVVCAAASLRAALAGRTDLACRWVVSQKGEFSTSNHTFNNGVEDIGSASFKYYLNKDENKYYLYSGECEGTVYIDNNLENESIVICADAFNGQEIYDLIVYDNVEEIESRAFVGCNIGNTRYYVFGTTTTQNTTQVANDAFVTE